MRMSSAMSLAAAASFAIVATASAQNVFDDFSSGNDNAWSRIDGPALFGLGSSTYSVASGAYTLTTPAYPNFGVAASTASVRPDGAAVNSQISVDVLGFTGVPVISINARGTQAPSGGFSYYSLSFFPISLATGPNGEARSNFRIDRFNADPANPGISTVTNLTSFDANAFPAVNPLNTFRMIFTVEGNTLSASLFDLTASSGSALISLSVNDNSSAALLGPGLPSLSVFSNANNPPSFPSVSATFDNFRVVPAPGAAAALCAGVLFAGRRRR